MAGVVITKCVICKEWIMPTEYGWAHGNNAAPVAEGRCCDDCDEKLVIPTRIRNMLLSVYEKALLGVDEE